MQNKRISESFKKIGESMSKNLFKKIVFLMCTFIFSFSATRAQEAISASGGDASGSGGAASYTVGQIFYSTITGTGGSEAQGVQQPYEISVVSGIEDDKSNTFQCSAYPNPTTEMLTLKIEGELPAQDVVSLYDIKGIRLEYKKISGAETSFDMKNLVPATYFLIVTNNNLEVRTFKIIKN
jgi:hypothetical protein